MRTQEQIDEIVRLLLAEYPEASCTLDYGKAYELLFSVRLAAQCTDERVNQITPALFARFPTLESFAEAFSSTADKRSIITGPLGAFYPSDQVNFRCGVGVAAMNKAPLIGLYMSRIHTKRDTVCDERNFAFLVEGARRFLRNYKTD